MKIQQKNFKKHCVRFKVRCKSHFNVDISLAKLRRGLLVIQQILTLIVNWFHVVIAFSPQTQLSENPMLTIEIINIKLIHCSEYFLTKNQTGVQGCIYVSLLGGLRWGRISGGSEVLSTRHFSRVNSFASEAGLGLCRH